MEHAENIKHPKEASEPTLKLIQVIHADRKKSGLTTKWGRSDSFYFRGWQEYEKNRYHQIHNPEGIIQMGLAENQLSLDLLETWIAKNSGVNCFEDHRDGSSSSIFRELALFQDYHGLPSFKKELGELMGEIRGKKVRYDPKKLVLTAGATSANETLMFCLAEPGEAFLIPAPYYPGFDRDVKWRTEVELVPVHCSSLNHFKITKVALEQAYQKAQKLKLNVKGILITNPSNPLGTTMSKDELNHLLHFAISKKIHIVSDEVYSGTVFDSPSFTSMSQTLKNHIKLHGDNEISKQIHIVYSLSKDLGLPGFRVGVIYSENEAIISAATKMSSFGLVSSQTQFLLSNILGDKKFRKQYMKENQKRLKERQEAMVLGFQSVGISCLRSNAGLFCWVDMRHLLSANSFEAEKELWEKILFEVRLNICPGSSCHCSEPGWFRVCFANMSTETLNLALHRMKIFVDSTSEGGQSCNQQVVCSSSKKSVSNWLFQLSSWYNHDEKYR